MRDVSGRWDPVPLAPAGGHVPHPQAVSWWLAFGRQMGSGVSELAFLCVWRVGAGLLRHPAEGTGSWLGLSVGLDSLGDFSQAPRLGASSIRDP